MSRLQGTDAYPYALFKPNSTSSRPTTWLQSAREKGHAAPERRIPINFDRGKGFDPLCHVALDLMERDLGGHADRHDPYVFKWVLTEDGISSVNLSGTVYVAGKAWSGDS